MRGGRRAHPPRLTPRRERERLTATVPRVDPASRAPLPSPLTAFVGRDEAIADLSRLLESARLLTLTGTGGSGKTRLALELAHRAQRASPGRGTDARDVAWVELAPLADAHAVAAHIARALGIRVEGAASAEQALVASLAGERLLLVLDNCEHVVEECARVAQQLLAGCAGLRILATSREALGVAGERSWLVPPMALPAPGAADIDALARTESVRLFVERAQEVSRTFVLTAANVEAVVRICRRLDGLPLAIELAAARIAVLTPAQVAERLEDRFALLVSSARAMPARQRTLRGAVDWSYDLLGEEERLLLERLSVFAGGFTLDAAEAVCAGGPVTAERVLDLLAALATRSLVTMQEEGGQARYLLLETIREYARERRAARAAADGIEERHARHYLAVARDAEPALLLGRPASMRLVDVEHENILAALAWSARERAGARYGLPIAWALLWYWFHRQLWREGFAEVARALGTADHPATELRAAALHGLGLFGMYARDPESAARLAEAQRLWREAGNERWQVFTTLVETVAASLRRDVAAATAHAEAMIALARRQPDPWCLALAQAHGMVPVLVWQQRWAEAAKLLDEALATYQALDYAIGIAYVHDAQAFVSLQRGDEARAVRLACASLREDPASENRWLAGRSLRILGAVAARQHDEARAVTLFGAADAMYEAIGAASLTEERAAVNGLPAQLRATMPASAFEAAWTKGRALRFREAVALALEAEADDVPAVEARPTVVAAHAAAAAEPAAGPALEVLALGTVRVLRDGVELAPAAWSYAKPRELLLYLLAHPEGRTREQIGLDFWPEISAAQVKNNFHVTLHHLRKALGGAGFVRFERGRYRVPAEAGVRFDVARFEDGTAQAMRGVARGDAGALAALDAALALYRGPFLDEEQAGDWHLAIRDRLARVHDDAVEALAAAAEARGDHRRAADALRRLLTLDATHEDAARRLMRVLSRDGRRGEALDAFDRLARALETELDAAPTKETAALAARIRAGDPP